MPRVAMPVLLLCALLSCERSAPPPRQLPSAAGATVTFHTGGGPVVFTAAVADDDLERTRGLMGRRSLGAREGMLFLWPKPGPRRFWMKSTPLPLDLIAIRRDRVTAIFRLLPCDADPCPETETGVIDAAFEMAAGTASDLGIRPGDRVSIERQWQKT